MFLFFLKDGSLVLAQALAALGLGLLLTRPLRGTLCGEDGSILALAAGYGALSLATLALGVGSSLRPFAVFFLWVAGLLALLMERGQLGLDREFWRAWRRPVAFSILLATAATGNLLYAHAPPVMDDSVYIYLAIPQAYARAGRLLEIPENAHAYFPQTIEMLYAQLMLWGTGETAKLLHWFFGILATLAAGRIGWRFLGARRLGLIGAALYAVPWVTSLSGTGKIDLGSLFYAVAAFQAFLVWREDGQDRTLILAGLLSGFHFGTKYTGAALVIAMAFWAAVSLQCRGWRGWILLAGFGGAALLPVLPWLLRNLALKGNPVFPAAFLGHAGDPYLTAALGNADPGSWAAYSGYAFETLFLGEVVWGTGPLLWALLPIAILDARRRSDEPRLTLVAIGCLHFMISFLLRAAMPMTRFFPGLFLLSLATASWLDGAWDAIRGPLKVLLWVALLAPAALLSAYFGGRRLPLWLGLETPERFLERSWKLPEDFGIYRFIRENVPKGETILFAGLNVAPAYLYPDHWAAGLGLYPPEFYNLPVEEAADRLRKDGVGYVVVTAQDCRFEPDGTCVLPLFGVRLSWMRPESLAKRFRLLAHGERSALYQLKDTR